MDEPNDAQGHPQVVVDDDVAATLNVDPNIDPGAPRTPTGSRTYNLKVYGKNQTLTEDELVKVAQKGLAADQKWQETAEKLKAAEADSRIVGDLKKVLEGDASAYRRLAANFDIPGDQVEDVIRRMSGDAQGEDGDEEDWEEYDDDPRVPKRKQTVSETRKTGYKDFEPDVQRLLKRAERNRIDEIVKESLDSDEELTYNMKALDDGGRKTVLELVRREIKGRLAETGDFGEGEMLKDILPFVKQVVNGLGAARRGPQLGLGPSPSGAPATAYPTREPDRVSSQDPGYEQYVLDSLAYHLTKGSEA